MTLGPRGRRWLFLALASTVPVLLFANVLQGMRYTRLERAVRELEQEQIAWFEKNKTLLAAIGIHSAPRRLESLVDADTRRERGEPTIRVKVENEAAGRAEGTDGR